MIRISEYYQDIETLWVINYLKLSMLSGKLLIKIIRDCSQGNWMVVKQSQRFD